MRHGTGAPWPQPRPAPPAFPRLTPAALFPPAPPRSGRVSHAGPAQHRCYHVRHPTTSRFRISDRAAAPGLISRARTVRHQRAVSQLVARGALCAPIHVVAIVRARQRLRAAGSRRGGRGAPCRRHGWPAAGARARGHAGPHAALILSARRRAPTSRPSASAAAAAAPASPVLRPARSRPACHVIARLGLTTVHTGASAGRLRTRGRVAGSPTRHLANSPPRQLQAGGPALAGENGGGEICRDQQAAAAKARGMSSAKTPGGPAGGPGRLRWGWAGRPVDGPDGPRTR